MMEITIAVLGTFDTKAQEFAYLADAIRAQGAGVLTIDTGTGEKGTLKSDYGMADIAALMKTTPEKVNSLSRGEAMGVVIPGVVKLVEQLYGQGKFDGIVSMGGSGGTTIATAAMRALPVGVPKVVATTQAAGAKMPGFIGAKDLIVINSIVDVSGLNSITRCIFSQAAGAVVGAARAAKACGGNGENKPRVAVSMYGITTPCVNAAMAWLEEKGYEVIVFHANGAGGRAMKTLIKEGYFDGVLDITTSEVTAYLLESESASAGADRLDAAAEAGIPQVVSVGGMDVIGITVPELKTRFKGFVPYLHNDVPDNVCTRPQDNAHAGQYMARRLNRSTAPCAVFLPLRGISALDVEGGPTWNAAAREALFGAIKDNADPEKVEVVEMDSHLNDTAFAVAMAEKLHGMMCGSN